MNADVTHIVCPQWYAERLSAAFPGARGVFRGEIPKEQNQPAIVFTILEGVDMLVQEKTPLYVDFVVDVFAVSARGDRRYPDEDFAIIHSAINTDSAGSYSAVWLGVSSTWEITCDRISTRAMAIADGAGDYRMSGGRYAVRIERS